MAEEEKAIPQNRSTHCTAKLVAVKAAGLGTREIEILPCVERRVSNEFENFAMKMIVPALRRHTNHSSVVRSLRREEEAFVNLELVDRRNGEL